jgi:hypothetical protein
LALDVVIESQCVLLDASGDEEGTEGVVLAIGGVLDGEERYGEGLHKGLQEVPQCAEVFSVAVEVDKAFFSCSTGLIRDLQVRHCSSVLLRENHTLLKLRKDHLRSLSPVITSPTS